MSGWGDADKDLIWTQKKEEGPFLCTLGGVSAKADTKDHTWATENNSSFVDTLVSHAWTLDNGLKRKINMSKI